MEGEYEPSALDWVRKQVEQIEETGTTEGVQVMDRPIVLMTYRGKKSGKVRKTPVMRVEDGGRYAAIASYGGSPKHPQWYESLIAEPEIELQDGTSAGTYRVRELSGEERETWWDRSVAAYPPYADYQEKTDRQIPVLVLEPVA